MRGALLQFCVSAALGAASALIAVPATAQDVGFSRQGETQTVELNGINRGALSIENKCSKADGNDVIVCGRRGNNHYRIDPNILATDRRIDEQQLSYSNDPVSQVETCGVGPRPCPGVDTIPITAIALVVADVVARAATGDDWREALKTVPREYETYQSMVEKTGKK